MEDVHGFFGDFSSWEEAQSYCEADNVAFMEKVLEAILKVKAGEAAYERDSLVYDQILHSYPIIAYLLMIATANDSKLHIVDIGGSLGSQYFEFRGFLQHLREVNWNVIEREHFVACGREHVQDDQLKFYYTIDECMEQERERPRAALLSGVLQCIEEPYPYLRRLLEYGFDYILFDRTPFIPANDRLTIYVVPQNYDDASYPFWMFNWDSFLSVFQDSYELVDAFDSYEKLQLSDGIYSQFKGCLFKKKR